MTSSSWPDCIVGYVDLVGISALAESGEGSRVMRELHEVATGFSRCCPAAIEHLYAWNDSLICVSFVDAMQDVIVPAVLDALRELKRAVDRVRPSYVIAVRGQAFPSPGGLLADESRRLTVLGTSSWAMANCFRIEERLGKKKMSWYIDSRITRDAGELHPSDTSQVKMYPKDKARRIDLFADELR